MTVSLHRLKPGVCATYNSISGFIDALSTAGASAADIERAKQAIGCWLVDYEGDALELDDVYFDARPVVQMPDRVRVTAYVRPIPGQAIAIRRADSKLLGVLDVWLDHKANRVERVTVRPSIPKIHVTTLSTFTLPYIEVRLRVNDDPAGDGPTFIIERQSKGSDLTYDEYALPLAVAKQKYAAAIEVVLNNYPRIF